MSCEDTVSFYEHLSQETGELLLGCFWPVGPLFEQCGECHTLVFRQPKIQGNADRTWLGDVAHRQVGSEVRGKGKRGAEVIVGEAHGREPGCIEDAPGHVNFPIDTMWWAFAASE